jgi:hypothetical protein
VRVKDERAAADGPATDHTGRTAGHDDLEHDGRQMMLMNGKMMRRKGWAESEIRETRTAISEQNWWEYYSRTMDNRILTAKCFSQVERQLQ